MALEAIRDHKLMQNEKNMLPGKGIEPTPSVAKNFPSVKKINFPHTWKIFYTLGKFLATLGVGSIPLPGSIFFSFCINL